ncbi:YqzL family protein [Tepidanaerobacter sp. EBM-38]
MCVNLRKGWSTVPIAEFFWNIFEVTGSITAYLIYRELLMS